MRSFHFPGRSPVYGRRAMCATSHPAASLVAIETLKAGGNAVDAAIAAAGGAGGGRVPDDGHRRRLLCHPAPAWPEADCAQRRRAARRRPPPRTGTPSRASRASRPPACMPSPCPAPSTAGARLLEDHGTMPLAKLLAPAIALAEGGFVVAPRVAADWANGARKSHERRRQAPPAQGRPRARGGRGHALSGAGGNAEADRQGRPRRLLRGRGGQGHGGGARRRSAACTRSTISPRRRAVPATSSRSRSRYQGVDLIELPPSNQGIVALIMLKMLERLGKGSAGPVSVERYHVLMEVARLAYAMRDTFVADPGHGRRARLAHARRCR